jgi:hypothetical protein
MLNQAFLAQKLGSGGRVEVNRLKPLWTEILPGDGGKPIKANE